MSFLTASIPRLKKQIADGDLTSTALLETVFQNIDRYESRVHAYISIEDRARLLAQAADRDARRARGEKAPHGIPLAIKDNIAVSGQPLTAGSRVLENFISPYDATVIRRLRDDGFVFIGKTNLDEWAFGSSTEFSAYGVTRNPHDTERVPGGSSGGSGAAVAYGGAVCALGSDTGGSIRLPSAFCGIYALKPTYGSVSRFGLIAFGSSLDQIGPMTTTITDLEYILKVIQARDPLDETSREIKFSPPDVSEPLVIGVPKDVDAFLRGCDDVVQESYRAFLKMAAARSDTRLKPLDLDNLNYGLPIYYIIAPSEASSNLSRYDGVRYGRRADSDNVDDLYQKTRASFGDEAKLRVLTGTFCLSAGYQDAYYNRATRLRAQLRGWMRGLFDSCHAIAIPTSPTTAFRLGERSQDPLAMYKTDIYTVAVNLSGMPAMTCPYFTNAAPLPTAIQLIGNHGDDYRLCEIGRRFEAFWKVRPPEAGGGA